MFHAVHLDQVMHFETSTIAGMPRNANHLESLVCHAAHVGHERANIMEPCLPNARIPPACLLSGRRRRGCLHFGGGSLCRLILVRVARLRDTAILMPEKKTEIPKTSEGCARNDFKQISGRPPERCIVVSLYAWKFPRPCDMPRPKPNPRLYNLHALEARGRWGLPKRIFHAHLVFKVVDPHATVLTPD